MTTDANELSRVSGCLSAISIDRYNGYNLYEKDDCR
jgi:hypothetical protein